MKAGDIVLVQDNNALRGQWKLAEVKEALVGQDGKVRNVTLRYKCQSRDKSEYTGQADTIITRSVHRLVLILEAEDATGAEVVATGGGSV